MRSSPRSFSETGGRWLAACLASGAAVGALAAGPAHAGQLQIMPTRLGVSADQPTTTMFATNAETTDASYQVTVFRWSQRADGSDQLDPTRDVLANPGIFTLKPGEQQIIRFGLRRAQPADGGSYRVVLQELPHTKQQTAGIQTLLRISVPIFVPAPNPVTTMRWALQAGDGGAQLLARNDGNVHVQITGIQIDGTNAPQASMRCSTYVLPGVSRTIKIRTAKPLAAGATFHVRFDTDQGSMSADLRADPAATAPVS